MLIFITFFCASYAIFTIVLYIFWQRMPFFLPAPSSLPHKLSVSVIIPVRNEENTILSLLQGLEAQSLSPTLFEVWVIDDASTDNTAELVKNFKSSYKLSLLPSELRLKHLSPKKRAIQTALQYAVGKLIVCTDGDCTVQRDWLYLFVAYQQITQAQWISGGVAFASLPALTKTAYFWSEWQAIEFSSLVGSGAITLSIGSPTMANGANLAYTRAAFDAVDGFMGNEHLASGDDEFLLHKIAKKFPKSVFFLKNPLHTVFTFPQPTLHDFYAQRKRWGSKWAHYQNMNIKVLAISIFLSNLCFLLNIIGFCFNWYNGYFFILNIFLKLVPEFVLLYSFSKYFSKGKALFIPIVQLTYPFYVVFFGLISLVGKGYQWKGRSLR